MEAINSTCTDLEMLTFERVFCCWERENHVSSVWRKPRLLPCLFVFFNGSVKLDHVYINNMLQVVLHYLQ